MTQNPRSEMKLVMGQVTGSYYAHHRGQQRPSLEAEEVLWLQQGSIKAQANDSPKATALAVSKESPQECFGFGPLLLFFPPPQTPPFAWLFLHNDFLSPPRFDCFFLPTPRVSPNTGSASFLPQDQIENANDEAEAEADPGQDEAIAMVGAVAEGCIVIGIAISVDGCSNQNTQPAHQHGGPGEEEPVSFLHGEELEHEDHQGDDGEDDGEDHEGLHTLKGIFISI